MSGSGTASPTTTIRLPTREKAEETLKEALARKEESLRRLEKAREAARERLEAAAEARARREAKRKADAEKRRAAKAAAATETTTAAPAATAAGARGEVLAEVGDSDSSQVDPSTPMTASHAARDADDDGHERSSPAQEKEPPPSGTDPGALPAASPENRGPTETIIERPLSPEQFAIETRGEQVVDPREPLEGPPTPSEVSPLIDLSSPAGGGSGGGDGSSAAPVTCGDEANEWVVVGDDDVGLSPAERGAQRASPEEQQEADAGWREVDLLGAEGDEEVGRSR